MDNSKNTKNNKSDNVDSNSDSNERLIKDYSKLKVMILDDNKLFRKFLYKLLEINYKIKSIEMDNPKAALLHLKNEIPDLILLDMEMPFIDGYSFLKAIRKVEATKDLPVLPITAINSKELIVSLTKEKIEDFIIKTTTPDVMLEKFTKVFNRISNN